MSKFKMEKFKITIEGLAPIVFDRHVDHSEEKRPPDQKFYLAPGNKVVLPAENVFTFLMGQKPPGCAKKFEGKKSGNYMAIGQGHVVIEPDPIPFFDTKEKEIIFEKFDDKRFKIVNGAPRVIKGNLSIKLENNPRPCLLLPWKLSFSLSLIQNDLIDENKLRNWFDEGGIVIGLGNWRPKHGRFFVAEWQLV